MERIEGLHARGRAIEAAYLQNFAFNDGEQLATERREWEALLRVRPGETPGTLSEADLSTIARIMRHWAPRPAAVS